ncbi:MAG: hypothetical protein AB7T06_00545 [Kofleriaceae bacterium]
MRLVLAALLVLGGCIDAIDPRWTLDHDHVVAMRTSKPGLLPGESALIDALVAHEDGPATIEEPIEAAGVTTAPTLEGAIYTDGGRWYVYGPSEATLAIVRTELGLAPGEPVPLDIYAAFARADGEPMIAKKRVWLGTDLHNPAPPVASMDGSEMPAVVTEGPRAGLAPEIVVPANTDVYFATTVNPAWRVNWLSSCGTLFQDDVATSFLRVLDEDSHEGELAVVVRDPDGGVAWRVWPLRTE